jgi:hypothetical protein
MTDRRPTTDDRSSDKAKKPWHEPVLRDLGSVTELTASSQSGGGTDGPNNYITL